MTTMTTTYRDDFDADQGAYKYASKACRRDGSLAEKGRRWSMTPQDLRQEFIGWAWASYSASRAKGIDHPTAMAHGIAHARQRVASGRPLSGGERHPGPAGIRYHDEPVIDFAGVASQFATRTDSGEHWLTQVEINQ